VLDESAGPADVVVRDVAAGFAVAQPGFALVPAEYSARR
jgi:hypothetical protein